jgi:hypothetical protein
MCFIARKRGDTPLNVGPLPDREVRLCAGINLATGACPLHMLQGCHLRNAIAI